MDVGSALVPFWHPFWLQNRLKRGREAIFGNGFAPNLPRDTPRPSKYVPRDPPGSNKNSKWHPLDLQKNAKEN